MEAWFPYLFTAAALVIGTVVAIFWWRIAAKAAPYADEAARRDRKSADVSENEVVVVSTEDPK